MKMTLTEPIESGYPSTESYILISVYFLIFFLAFLLFGLLLNKYLKTKNKLFLAMGSQFLGLALIWLPSIISSILMLTIGQRLERNLYMVLAVIFFPLVFFGIYYVGFNFVWPEKSNWALYLTVLYSVLFFGFHFTDLEGTTRFDPVYGLPVHWIEGTPMLIYFLFELTMLVLVIFILKGIFITDNKEVKIKLFLFALGQILLFAGGLSWALGPKNVAMFVAANLIIALSMVLIYFSLAMPEFLRKRLA